MAKSKQSVSIQTDERERCDQESQTYSGGPRCDQAVQTIAEKTIQYVQEDGSPWVLTRFETSLLKKPLLLQLFRGTLVNIYFYFFLDQQSPKMLHVISIFLLLRA